MELNYKKNNSQPTTRSDIDSAARRQRRNRTDTYNIPNTYQQLANIYREIAENDKRKVQPDSPHSIKTDTVLPRAEEFSSNLNNAENSNNLRNNGQFAETSIDETNCSSPTLVNKTHHYAEIHQFTNRSNKSTDDSIYISDDSPGSDDCDNFVTLYLCKNKKYLTSKSHSSNLDSSFESKSTARSDDRAAQKCGENKENVQHKKQLIDEQIYELKDNAEYLLKDIICSQPRTNMDDHKLPKLNLTDVKTSSDSLSDHMLSTVVEVCENVSNNSIKSPHSEDSKKIPSKADEGKKINLTKPWQISVNKWMLDAESVNKDERQKMEGIYMFEHEYNVDESLKLPHIQYHNKPVDPLQFIRNGYSTGDCNYNRRGSFQCTSTFEDYNYKGNPCAGDNLPEPNASQRLYQKSNVLLRSAPWELYQRSVLTQDIDDLEITISNEDSERNMCSKWLNCFLCSCKK